MLDGHCHTEQVDKWTLVESHTAQLIVPRQGQLIVSENMTQYLNLIGLQVFPILIFIVLLAYFLQDGLPLQKKQCIVQITASLVEFQ